MSRVTTVECGNTQDIAPVWEAVKARLLGMRDGDFTSLWVNEDTCLIVLFIADLGWLVTGCEEGEKEYYSLIERSLGDDPVTAFDGGNMNNYPRFTFVSEQVLLKATKRYFLTGERDPGCEWVIEGDASYD